MAIRNYRYLAIRKATIVGIMGLFIGTYLADLTLLRGNLSTAVFLGEVPLADPYHVFQMLAAGQLPGADLLLGMLIVLAFYMIVAGRAFCSWVCPMNLISDAAAWVRRKAGIEASYTMSRSVRYWIVALSLVVSGATGAAAFEWISPVSMLHRGLIYGMGAGWLAVLGVFVFDLLVMKNGFCGHLCPLGGFYAITGKYSILKPRYEKDKCNMCNKCFVICPEPQVLDIVGTSSGWIRSGECTNCGRCIDVCDDNAIRFRFKVK